MYNPTPGASHKSTRYYYTDPLAATWMTKQFGIQVTAVNTHTGDYWPGLINWEQLLLEHQNYDRFDILLDSLHLLEPQVGDLVLHTEAAMDSDYDGDLPRSGCGIYDDYRLPSDVERVIQRNGIAFMWPESDAAA